MEKRNNITAIIIDDDEFCSFQLQDIISTKVRGIDILAICTSGADGLNKICSLLPDVVFLDVEMPDMNGFEMLKKLPAINFDIIFITAYDHYAIRAIRFSAIDYLLKPVNAAALQEAMGRVLEKRESNNFSNHQLEIFNNPVGKKLENLAVPTMEGLLFVGLNEIVSCESNDKYTTIFLVDKKKIVASRTLGDFEDLLTAHGFFRIHKSYLINLKHMKKYLRGDGGQVIMADGATLDVSRRKKDELLKLVSQF